MIDDRSYCSVCDPSNLLERSDWSDEVGVEELPGFAVLRAFLGELFSENELLAGQFLYAGDTLFFWVFPSYRSTWYVGYISSSYQFQHKFFSLTGFF